MVTPCDFHDWAFFNKPAIMESVNEVEKLRTCNFLFLFHMFWHIQKEHISIAQIENKNPAPPTRFPAIPSFFLIDQLPLVALFKKLFLHKRLDPFRHLCDKSFDGKPWWTF